MTLPNLSSVVTGWATPYPVKTVTTTTVDFVPTEVVTRRNVNAMAQPAKKSELKIEQIDWSLDYLLIHAIDDIAMSEFFEFDGRDFKIVARGDWTSFGYREVIGEETKRTLLEVTP